ncbi:hypothetical protein SDC9_52649 [bioreactor metagenome]|uniref:Uncharacterized protein n=1 Tax=bioreactor metagenome TaxID=1076179 RepID=A0A644WR85_9ZZZZ
MKNDADYILKRGLVLLEKINPVWLVNSVNSLKTALERRSSAIAVIGIGSLKDTVNVLNITFGYHFLDADRLAYVHKPCRIQFVHAPEEESLPEESIKKLYAALEANSDGAVNMVVGVPCDSVRDCAALLLFSPRSGPGIDWERENALFDYALFVTNTHAALDIEERTFLGEIGAKLIGTRRLALALANSGFVTADDYQQVVASAEKFLQRTLGSGVLIVADSDDELTALYEKELLPKLREHYDDTVSQIAGLNTKMILETISDAKKRFGVNSDEINRAVFQLERRKDLFAQKAESLCAMAAAFVEGGVKAPLLREMADYSQRLRETAVKGARKLDSLEEAAQSIESYFRTSWEHFLREQLPAVRDMFEEEAGYIERQVRADIGELFESIDDFLFQFGPYTDHFAACRISRDPVFPGCDFTEYLGERKPVKTSMLMIAATIPLAVTNFPMALVAVATSFGMRNQEKRLERERQAASVEQMVEEAEDYFVREMRCDMDNQFDAGLEQLRGSIRQAYARMIDSALKSLEELRASLDDLHEKMRFIDAFQAETEIGSETLDL